MFPFEIGILWVFLPFSVNKPTHSCQTLQASGSRLYSSKDAAVCGRGAMDMECQAWIKKVGIMMIIQWIWGYRRKRLSHETGNAG